jgi:hypothetical protein
MTSRPLVILGVIIILVAIVAAAGYAVNGRVVSYSSTVADRSNGSSTAPVSISPTFYQSTSTPDSSANSSGSNSNGSNPNQGGTGASTGVSAGQSSGKPSGQPDMNGSIPLSSIPFPASTTVSTASWMTFTDKADGYSFEHPADLSQNVLNGNDVFSFPKNTYFHWPLLDDAKVGVTVGPSCPKITAPAPGQAPVQFALNGYQFTRTIGSDVGAGQLYTEVAYDTQANGNCYHIDFLDHATDGAGFYVDDASLIAKYDAQHVADLSSVISIFNGIVGSFHILAPAH